MPRITRVYKVFGSAVTCSNHSVNHGFCYLDRGENDNYVMSSILSQETQIGRAN